MHLGSLDRRDYSALDRATMHTPAPRASYRNTDRADGFYADLDAVAAELARAVATATDYAGAYAAAELAAKRIKGWDAATLSDLIDEAVNAAF